VNRHETKAIPKSRSLDTLLAAFAAGRLSEAFAALVAAHLELKTESRPYVTDLEIAGGILLDDIEPVAMDTRDRRLAAILVAPVEAMPAWRKRNWDIAADAADELLPPALRAYAGCEFDELEWDTIVPGLRRCTVASDRNGESSFVRCRAGKRIPWHRHGGIEAVLVLQGGFDDPNGHYLRGDIAVPDTEFAHRPIADPNEECIYFVARESVTRDLGTVGEAASPLVDD
jgi:putative transcriptional regulator